MKQVSYTDENGVSITNSEVDYMKVTYDEVCSRCGATISTGNNKRG